MHGWQLEEGCGATLGMDYALRLKLDAGEGHVTRGVAEGMALSLVLRDAALEMKSGVCVDQLYIIGDGQTVLNDLEHGGSSVLSPWTAEFCWDHFRWLFVLLRVHKVQIVVIRFVHRERNKMADSESKEAGKDHEWTYTSKSLSGALPGLNVEPALMYVPEDNRSNTRERKKRKEVKSHGDLSRIDAPQDIQAILDQLDIERHDDFAQQEHELRFRLRKSQFE